MFKQGLSFVSVMTVWRTLNRELTWDRLWRLLWCLLRLFGSEKRRLFQCDIVRIILFSNGNCCWLVSCVLEASDFCWWLSRSTDIFRWVQYLSFNIDASSNWLLLFNNFRSWLLRQSWHVRLLTVLCTDRHLRSLGNLRHCNSCWLLYFA